MISYRPAKLPIPQLSESNCTEAGIRHSKHTITTSLQQYLVFILENLIKVNYQAAKFHWPRLSGSNFTRGGGGGGVENTPTDLYSLKNPSTYRVKCVEYLPLHCKHVIQDITRRFAKLS